jgi:hypothetical protein
VIPGSYDLLLYRGDTWARRFRLWQDDAMTLPVDLTGSTVAAEYRANTNDTNAVAFDCAVTDPNIVDVGWHTWVDCPLSGVWDMQVTFADGTITTYVAGRVRVTADVTAADLVAVP